MPELLEARRMSQADLARRLDVSEAFISLVIKGKRYFSYEMALNAAFILKCAVDELHEINLE